MINGELIVDNFAGAEQEEYLKRWMEITYERRI